LRLARGTRRHERNKKKEQEESKGTNGEEQEDTRGTRRRNKRNKTFDAPGLWLDNDNGNERRVEISGDTLRGDTLWRDYRHPRRRDIIARGIPND
jgi:hypothetical protein